MGRNDGPPDGIHRLLGALAAVPVLPVLRTPDRADAVALARAAVSAGLTSVELTATTTGWEQALASLRADHPDLLLGLGTVRDRDTAQRAAAAGADFLVTPYAVPGVSGAGGVDGVPVVTGAWTPSEVATAAAGGLVKLFPAHVGGPDHLRGLLAVMPELAVVPTGGVEPLDVPAWLDAGAVGVGLGSGLVRWLREDPSAVAGWVVGMRGPDR